MRALVLGLGILFMAVSLPAQASRASSQRPPNIVLIVADDLGYGELGCYGQAKISTPACDRLAAEGMRFTDAYCGAPVCAPSRCVLLTGQHSGHAAIRDNREVQPEGQQPLPLGTVTIAKLLRDAGYATACVGKWGLGGPGTSGEPLAQGFDRFYGYLCQRKAHDHYPEGLWRDRERVPLARQAYTQDLFAAEVRSYLEEKRDQPFFLLFTPAVPHLALQVPDRALAPYAGKWEEQPYDGKKGYRPHPTPRAAYAAMVAEFDRGVGVVLETLKRRGLDESTLVLVTSDNGPTHDVGGVETEFFASAGPLRGRKGSCYEGGIRVPLLARWPGTIVAGSTSARAVGAPDLLPTLCDLAHAKLTTPVDGASFVPTLLGRTQSDEPAPLYWEFPGYGGWQALRIGRWKAVRKQIAKTPAAGFELYDLATDPGETKDVAGSNPELIARATKLAGAAHVASSLFPFPALDAAVTVPRGK